MIEGTLIYRERQSGVVIYGKWRDRTGRQVMRKLGPGWVRRRSDQWQKRGGPVPAGYLVPNGAAARLREVIDAHEHEITDTDARKSWTFEAVAWAWHAHGEAVAGWSPATVQDRRFTLSRHLIPAFGERPIQKLDSAEVRVWWRSLHDPKREGGRVSDRNANKLLTELRAILNWAHDDYGLTTNAAAGIAKHREHTSEAAPFYSVAQVEALASCAGDDQDALAFRVAAFAGLRRGELVSLRWRHIDFVRCNVYIDESVSAGQDTRPKWGSGRTVPLAPQLAKLLIRPDDAADGDLVFSTKLGGKLDGSGLSKRYRKARDAAGLPPLRFHDLRHTFGTLAVDGGASLVQVQAWLGHSDIRTTMRYLHSKSRQADADLLGEAFAA
jgi:integrase